MRPLSVEWDPAKGSLNPRKHGVSFLEAESVFEDENGILLEEGIYLHDEPRYVLLGLSLEARVVVVVHCDRAAGATIRIISARKATAAEPAQYLTRWKR